MNRHRYPPAIDLALPRGGVLHIELPERRSYSPLPNYARARAAFWLDMANFERTRRPRYARKYLRYSRGWREKASELGWRLP